MAATRWRHLGKRLGLVVGLLLSLIAYAVAEDLTLTTYYPSPRGVYQELRTSGDVVVGDVSTPPGARLHVLQDGIAPAVRVDDESADPSPFLIDQDGNMGVKTDSPTTALDVRGGVRVGVVTTCNASVAGTLRAMPTAGGYNLSFCNGIDWIPLVSSSASCSPAGESYVTSYQACSCGASSYIWEGTQTCTCGANGNWSCVATCTPPPPGAPPPPCPPWY